MIKHHQREISDEVDWMGIKLAPLLDGHCVTLVLQQPKARGRKQNQLMTFVPGILLGYRETCVVVSVIDSGSAIVDCKVKKISNLCMAGVPAKLASVLSDKLFNLYKDV